MNAPGEMPERLTESLEVVEPRFTFVAIPVVLAWLAEIATARFCTNNDGVESISTESVYMPTVAEKSAGWPNLQVWLALLVAPYGSTA